MAVDTSAVDTLAAGQVDIAAAARTARAGRMPDTAVAATWLLLPELARINKKGMSKLN